MPIDSAMIKITLTDDDGNVDPKNVLTCIIDKDSPLIFEHQQLPFHSKSSLKIELISVQKYSKS